MNHAELLRAVVAAVPDRRALRTKERTLTYSQLQERIDRFADLLLAEDVTIRRPREELTGWESGQDHVGLYLHNGTEYLEGTFGAAAARAAAFNVNSRYVADEIVALLDDADAAALVYHATFAPTVAEVVPRLRRRPLLLQVADDSGQPLLDGARDYETALATASSEPPATEPHPDDLHIVYTGGTTGMPKGTLWTQGALFEAMFAPRVVGDLPTRDLAAVVERALAGPQLTVMPLPPMTHAAALWTAMMNLLAGATIAFPDVVHRFDPAAACATIERERVQIVSMVGDAFARPLCDEVERGSYDLTCLLALASGGAALSARARQRLLDALPQAIVLDGVGASETGAHLSTTYTPGRDDAGIFDATDDTCVLDEAKAQVLEAGHDGVGWLARHGPIPLGYLGDEEKTARTFPTVNGRRMVVPGDRARRLADGRIELLGREAVTINTGGEKVFAEEVEQALLAHPEVVDAIVVGRDSERWGQEVVAVVQIAPDRTPTDEDLLAVVGSRLARYKVPKVIVRVDAVRRSPVGKADYAWARQAAEGG